MSVHKNGQVAIVETSGNKDCHVILRGGKTPNYDAKSVAQACHDLQAAKLHPSIMIDFSHANSSKQHELQVEVAKDVAAQLANHSQSIFGVMIESHLEGGAQKFTPGKDDPKKLLFGQSNSILRYLLLIQHLSLTVLFLLHYIELMILSSVKFIFFKKRFVFFLDYAFSLHVSFMHVNI